jgi:hypothetical protein
MRLNYIYIYVITKNLSAYFHTENSQEHGDGISPLLFNSIWKCQEIHVVLKVDGTHQAAGPYR